MSSTIQYYDDAGKDIIINDIVMFYQRQRLIFKVNFFWFLFCRCKHFAMLIKMSPAFIFFQLWIHFSANSEA